MTSVTSRALLAMIVCLGSTAAWASETLYVRLGGAPGVQAISDTLIDRAAADPVTGPAFEGTRLARIKRLLAEQICALSGGPCVYSGDSMKRSHAGLHISQAMFYRLVEILQRVLDERAVDRRARNELLRLLAPAKRDVVEHTTARRSSPPPAAVP